MLGFELLVLSLTLSGLQADTFADAGVEPFSASDAGVPFQSVVKGSRGPDLRRIAGSATLLTEEDLERRELNDIHRVLAEVPGVYFREEDGLGLRPNIGLRGASPDRSAKVTLLEDGVLLGPAPYSAPAAYYFPMVTRMVGLEVFKGPAAIRFGPQTIGGAVALTTREVPTRPALRADVAVGSRNQARVHGVAALANAQWGLLAEGVLWRDSGFKSLDGGGDTGFERSEYMLKGRWTPDKPLLRQLELKATASFEDSRETYLGLSDEDFQKQPNRRYSASALDRMVWQRYSLVAKWLAEPMTGMTLSTNIYRHQFSRTWTRLDAFREGPPLYELLSRPVQGGLDGQFLSILRGTSDATTDDESLLIVDNARLFISQGIQSELKWQFATGPFSHELEASVRLHQDEIQRNHRAQGYAMRVGRLVRDTSQAQQTALNRGASQSLSLHVGDALSFGRVLLAPGARLEVIESDFSDQLGASSTKGLQVVPLLGLGAVVSLFSGLNAFTGIHQGFSPVTPGQDAQIRPERATHLEAGLRSVARKRRFELVGFFSAYGNITGECTGSSGCAEDSLNRQYNGGAARIVGLEAMASTLVSLPGGLEFTPQATYTLTRATFQSAFTSANPSWGNVAIGDSLPYIPMHQGALRLRFEWQSVRLSVGAEASGAFREEAQSSETSPLVPMRLLLDATASFRIGPATFYAQGTNLLNAETLVARRPFGARPLAPLAIQTGLRLDWP